MAKRIIDLSIPLYDFMPVGNVWAWDVPFQTQPITSIEKHGFDLFMITMHSETGTRLMPPAISDKTEPGVDTLDLNLLVDRETVVADCPKGADEEIVAADIDRIFSGYNVQQGDALLIRTGWGNGERYYKIGDDYARRTPHFAKDGADRLAELATERGINLVASDIAYYGWGGKHMLPEWSSKPFWERPAFPSEEARRYMHAYTYD